MNETNTKRAFVHWLRQSVLVTAVLLLLCGFAFPMVLSGISAVLFPHQAKGSVVTASGSGLDPHITPASASIQIPALAKASGLREEELKQIVENNTEGKLLGVFGEETVNVLGVNLDIAKAMGLVDEISK